MEGAERWCVSYHSNPPVPYASIDIQQFWQEHGRTQRLYEKESKISGDLLGHRTLRIGVTFYHEDWELRTEDQLMHHQFIMSMHPWPYPTTTCHLEGLWWLTADQITKDRWQDESPKDLLCNWYEILCQHVQVHLHTITAFNYFMAGRLLNVTRFTEEVCVIQHKIYGVKIHRYGCSYSLHTYEVETQRTSAEVGSSFDPHFK